MKGIKRITQRENMRRWLLLTSILLAALTVLGVAQALKAADEAALPPNLSQSVKTVNRSQAPAGATLEYNIIVKNTGNSLAAAAVTDTLPTGLFYVANSLVVQNGGSNWGVSGNVITWTGGINDGQQVNITFRATLANNLAVNTEITNTANIYLDEQENPVATPSATTTVTDAPDRRKAYLPLVFKPLPQVQLNLISRPGAGNSWTVSWSNAGPTITNYEVQEAINPAFDSATTFNVGPATSFLFNRARSFNNVYYYRVRGRVGQKAGPWSNVQTVAADYHDDFADANSGWAMRRTTAESTSEWEMTYRTDQVLQIIVKDKQETVLVSPLRQAPTGLPLEFETEATFIDYNGSPISDQQAFAFIFGANWNGETCPNATYSSCFNTYYRLRFRWRDGTPSDFWEHRLDWVKGHDANGEPIVDTLYDWTRIREAINPNTWNEVDVRIEPDGDIKVDIGDKRIGQTRHERIVTTGFDRYFGLEVSVKEKANARVKFSYFKIDRMTD